MMIDIAFMDLKQSEIGLLIALDALLESESVTIAAQTLGISQPAMSAQLARLRALFNDPLLTASGRKLLPTSRALEIKEQLRNLLADLDLLVRESTRFDPATTDRVFRIIGTDYVHAVLSSTLLEVIREQAPFAKIALLPFDPNTVWSQLEHDAADLGLTTGMQIPEARRRPGFSEQFTVIQRRNHPRGMAPFTLDTFCQAEHALISPEGGGFFGATDKLLASEGRKRRIACSLPSFLLAPGVVAGSDLVAVIPTRIATRFGDLIDQFSTPFPSPSFGVDILWHPRRQHDPAHTWLRSLMAKVMSEQ